MKPIYLLLSISVLLFACSHDGDTSLTSDKATTSTAKSTEYGVFSQNYLLEELDNGLRVMIVKTDFPDLVSLQIPMSVGARNEVEQGNSGFAHFFEHMMFKGSKEYPLSVYGDTYKSAGVDYRAYTSDDNTNYHLNFSKEHLEKVIEIQADHFINLTYTEAEFKTEALTVKGEYLKNSANPVRKLSAIARKNAFNTHPYEHTAMGFLEDIEAMPSKMAYGQQFFEQFYAPENATIIIVGDVEPAKTLSLVKEYWGKWKRGRYVNDIPTEPKQKQPIYVHEKLEGLPGHWLLVSYKGSAWQPQEKDGPTLDLISELYFSSNSDLYQELVVEKQIASQLFFYTPNTKDVGLRHVYVKVNDEKHLDVARNAINETYAKMRVKLISEETLEKLKSSIKYNFANGLDSSQSIAGMLANYMHFDRDPETVNHLYRTADSITAQDVQDIANKYFTDNNRTTVTLSALDTIEGFNHDVSIDDAIAKLSAKKKQHFSLLDNSNDSPLIELNLLFYTGAAADPEGQKGLSALMANMLTKGGSQTHQYKDIEQKMFPISGSFYAQVDKEMLSFRGRIHKDNVNQWYGLISDQLLNPGWREDDFTRVKKELLDSIKSGLKASNDEELGKEVLYSQLYQGHVYQSFNEGDISDLKALTIEEVKAFYRQQLTQAKLHLGITGAIPAGLKAKLFADLSTLPVGNEKRLTIASAPVLSGHHATIVEKEATSTAVSFGFPIDVRRSDEDWAALWLVRSYFGEHRSANSYLYQKIRQDRGMNYGDYAYIEYFPRGMYQTKPDANLGRSSQIFQIWLRPLRSNNDAHFATRAALYELDNLITHGMGEKDFIDTRNFLINYVPQLVDTQSKQLGYALDSEFYQTDSFVKYVREQLAKLTLADVNRVIKENLQSDNIHYVFISGDGEDMKHRLVNESRSVLVYNSEKSENIHREDKIIQNYPLSLPTNNVNVIPVKDIFK